MRNLNLLFTLLIIICHSIFAQVSFRPKINLELNNAWYFGSFNITGDGKSDIIHSQTGSNYFITLKNSSSIGNISLTNSTTFGSSVYQTRVFFSEDLNNDGRKDLILLGMYASGISSHIVSIYKNTSIGDSLTFDFQTLINTSGSSGEFVGAVKDFDGNGKFDLIFGYSDNVNKYPQIYRNTSSEASITFAQPVIPGGLSFQIIGMTTGDYNTDGKIDFIVSTLGGWFYFYRNTSSIGNISFIQSQHSGAASDLRSLQSTDFDGDGKIDIVGAMLNNSMLALFPNTSTTETISFATAKYFDTGLNPSQIALGDFNNDGKIDVAVCNPGSSSISIFINISTPGNFQFADRIDLTNPNTPFTAIAANDFDGDGKVDVIANYGSSLFIYLNNTPTSIPSIPNPTSPLNNSIGEQTNPFINWSNSAEAQTYLLQVAKDSLFTSLLFQDSMITTPNRQLSNLERSTTYYWRIRAKNSLGLSGWSSVYKFTTLSYLPPLTAWSYVSNTGNYATIGIPVSVNPRIGNNPIKNGDAIGAFFMRNDSMICAGYSIWQTGQNMVVNVWGDNDQTTVKDGFAPGDLMFFKIWDGQSQQEYPAIVNFQTGGKSYTTDGIYLMSSLVGVISHKISLNIGWNMISSFVLPASTHLDTVLYYIKSKLIIMKDGYGQVFWPSFSINTIGSWYYPRGYQVYVNAPTSLTISGYEIFPDTTGTLLSPGWRLISYLRNDSLGIDSSLYSIRGKFVIIKTGDGYIYWPDLGINTIKQMKPGRGYQIYMREEGQFQYPANITNAPGLTLSKQQFVSESNSTEELRFYKDIQTNSESYSVLLVQAPQLENGDEIAAWNSLNQLMGAGVVREGRALLIIWKPIQNETINDGQKATSDKITLTAWSETNGFVSTLRIESIADVLSGLSETELVYRDNAVVIAMTEMTLDVIKEFVLEQNYPNPFNPTTVIRYTIPKECKVQLSIYDLLGRMVTKLVDTQQKSGAYETTFDGRDLPTGIYFYKMQAGGFVNTKKLLLIR